jgi:DNA-binding NarL/FixJ family response regulator
MPLAEALAAPAHPRVAIIDADRRIRQSLADLLRLGGVDVVGTAGDVREALDLNDRVHPSVMIVDPRLPDIEAGAALLSSLHLAQPDLRVVLMGWNANPEYTLPSAGICAFIAKGATPEEFIAATVAACGAH